MYDIILFDLDGTLTDPGLGITNSTAYALKRWNIEVEDKASLNCFIGPPLDESLRKYFGFSQEDSKMAVEVYREYYREKGIFENKVYPGVEAMLSRLKRNGKKIILATSKPELFAGKILEHFRIDGWFDFVAGATMDGSRIKKADVIAYALQSCSITQLDRVVMVGDREHDIIGANQIGIDSIGVLYGYGSKEELEAAGATNIVCSVEDIPMLIL